MSLNYGFENIENYESVCWIGEGDDANMNPVTKALIFATMSVGLGSITDKNVDEFAARFRIIERIDGAMITEGGGKDYFLTDEDFITHIGLYTNVSNETRAQWARRIFVNKQTSSTERFVRQFTRDRDKAKVVGTIDGREVTAG